MHKSTHVQAGLVLRWTCALTTDDCALRKIEHCSELVRHHFVVSFVFGGEHALLDG